MLSSFASRVICRGSSLSPFLSSLPSQPFAQQSRDIQIFVRNGNVDNAMRQLNREMTQEKFKYKLKRKSFYEKPYMTRVRVKDRKERLTAVRKVERLKEWIQYERDHGGLSD